MTRRALLMTLIGVPITAKTVTAHNGVHLRGRLDKGRAPQAAVFGDVLTLEVQDVALWNAITPMLGADVQFSLFMP